MSEAAAAGALGREKAALRAMIRDRRQALTPDWVAATSARLGERLTDLPEIRKARVVLGYLALPGEASIDGLLRALQARGTRVCVPAAHGEPREYDAAWLPDESGLTVGPWGVREPARPEWVGDERIDVVLVPGVAFDAHGGRLGHGKGYYDRMLARIGARAGYRVGIAFGFQIVAAVPCGPRDVRMDAVVSETGVLRFADAAGQQQGERELTSCGL